MELEILPEDIKYILDGVSVMTAGAAALSWVPPLTAILAMLWMGLRVYSLYLHVSQQRRCRKCPIEDKCEKHVDKQGEENA